MIYRAKFLFNLLLSLINIAAWDKLKIPIPFKVLITGAVCWLSTGCDWGYWCVLMSFIFWKFRDKQILKCVLYAIWEYDHEHNFEVTKEAVAATCISDGKTEEKVCGICGRTEQNIVPAGGHNCVF